MANLSEYLKWRGDLSFEESSLNFVDGLLLSYICYIDADDIIYDGITIKELSDIYFKNNEEKQLRKKLSLLKNVPFVLREVAETERFKNIKIRNFKNEVSLDEEYQFSALSFDLTKDDIFISYRGTDDFLISWKEDFTWTYKKVIFAQEMAVNYLNKNFLNINKRIYIGGHSKGGNLAIFAGSKCFESIQDKIALILNYDGPGFYESFLNDSGYLKIKNKILTFLPEFSVIGMLLENDSKTIICKSSNKSIAQHDPVSWEVMGKDFIECEKVDDFCIRIDKTITYFLDNLPIEKREELNNVVFYLIKELKIEKLDDFSRLNLRDVFELITSNEKFSPEIKQLIGDSIKLMIKCNKSAKKDLKEGKKNNQW